MNTLETTPEFIELIGIEDFTLRRDFGRERGPNPVLTETSKRKIEELVQKLNYNSIIKSKKIEEEEEAITFDIRSRTRVVLFEGKVTVKSYNSLVPHTLRRYAYLLNDVLLITSPPSAGFVLFSEKLNIYHVINLNEISFIDLRNVNILEDASAFAIRTPKRPFHLFADSETDKRIWLEELEAAIFCVMKNIESKRLTWQHEIVLGTIYSAAVKGETELLEKHINKLFGCSLDMTDESGMTALHWASLLGRTDCVELLIEAGCDVDCLNSGLNSSLLLAAACGHDTIVHLLIGRGANVLLRNMKGADCLLMSVLYGHSYPGLRNIIIALQDHGVNVNKADASGAAPLHECAARSLSEPIQILVDVGANVNIKHERNGLTPLQIACSIAEPDPLTVCSFLDNGAYPNWKDAARRTAFDLVLSTHKNVKTRSPVKTYTKEIIATLSPFVQTALTTLIMIVRKGGRFTEESIQHLKPSFQDTILAVKVEWERLIEPDHFIHFISATSANIRSFKEMPDNASEYCLLCVDKFTYSNRRHHCRSCGILCCDLCSTKKLCFSHPCYGGRKHKQVLESPSERVCDGCFNRCVFECRKWIQNEVEAAKMHLVSQQRAEFDVPGSMSNVSNELTASCGSMGSTEGRTMNSSAESTSTSCNTNYKSQSFSLNPKSYPSPTKFASFSAYSTGIVTNSDIASVATVNMINTAMETRKALDERATRLIDTAERTEELNNVAVEFLDATARLLKQQSTANSWY